MSHLIRIAKHKERQAIKKEQSTKSEEKGHNSLLANAIPRPNRKRLQRRALIGYKAGVSQPALRHEAVGVGEITCGARGGEDVELDAGLNAYSSADAPQSVDG